MFPRNRAGASPVIAIVYDTLTRADRERGMVISEPALMYLEAAGNRLVRGFSSFWTGGPMVPVQPAYLPAERGPHLAGLTTVLAPVGAGQSAPELIPGAGNGLLDAPAAVTASAPDPIGSVVETGSWRAPGDVLPTDLDDALLVAVAETESAVASPAPTGPLTANERRAELAAYRAYLHARQRRFAQARAAFAEAAILDPQLALEATPGFWDLERSAHEAAVAAYADAGREREGAYLASRLRTTFRPRLVSAPIG